MTALERKQHRVCVVIPAFNEERRIAGVIRCVREQGFDVVVVDDGSADWTAAVSEQAGAVVVRHGRNRGKGLALNTAFAHAREKGYDVVITLDADGQHDPAEIPKFVDAYVRMGIPVLIGNRMGRTAGMPRIRRWTNEFMSWLLSRAMGQYVPDTQCGYRLFRTDVLPFVSAHAERFAAESEILLNIARRDIRIGAVPIATIYAHGKSHINPVVDTVRFCGMMWRFRGMLKRPR